ncbi:hypothetical protein RKE29_02720 [Streptomyces sp. B1866]|uniref:hypothetical protein n=1 Tax=Streptomyces sp. B1866 TaxID=3075431 RepID=UPI00288CCA44|nr:hypothetical protein [Streptomyces sp. B1866]MDT3395572.1 hypothetical protein [Streptomyces sp. B1866]
MTLDAMDWVWTRSESKGVARTVLLAIADRCTGPACTAYAGTAMLVQRSRAARSTVVAAVDKLLASGELAIVDGVKGPRGETCYRLPHAVGHTRPASEDARFAGPDPGPVQNPDRSEDRTPGGADSGPEGYGHRTPTGPDFGPQNASERKHQAEQQPRASTPPSPAAVGALRHLAEALAAAGVEVRWTLGLGEQHDLGQLLRRHGAAALVDLAAHRSVPGAPPKPARYWLRVWADLDRSPAARPAAAAPARPAAADAYADNLAAGLALLSAQKGSA